MDEAKQVKKSGIWIGNENQQRIENETRKTSHFPKPKSELLTEQVASKLNKLRAKSRNK